MSSDLLSRMAHDMVRMTRHVAALPDTPTWLRAGDVDWLDVCLAAGTAARETPDGDVRILLTATQRLATSCYLLGLYRDREAAIQRVTDAAIDEWEFAGFAARRLGLRPQNLLPYLTKELPR